MNEIPDLPVYSRNVLEFITVAHDYCITMNKAANLKKKQLLDYSRKVLPLLYLKADLLPEIEVQNPEANERFVTEEEWQSLFNHLRQIFGDQDEFWFTDQDSNPPEMKKGSLSEHFADIYQDLNDFVILYQKNSIFAKENAVAEIEKLFRINWGIRVVNTLKILHHFIAFQEEPDDPDITEIL